MPEGLKFSPGLRIIIRIGFSAFIGDCKKGGVGLDDKRATPRENLRGYVKEKTEVRDAGAMEEQKKKIMKNIAMKAMQLIEM